MSSFARRHPLVLYVSCAFLGFWSCLALQGIDHFWIPILGALAPGVAALLVSGLADGEPGVRALLRRLALWRSSPRWYLVAFGLPIAEGALALAVALPLGATSWARVGAIPREVLPILPALWVAYPFAAAEELGWRGFALPRLLATRSPLAASLLLGAIHALWHWPLILLPHQYLSDVPLWPWTTFVLAEAVVFTWIYLHTNGSVLLSALFHGTSNTAMILFDALDPAWLPRLKPAIAVLVTLTVVALAGPGLASRRPR